MAIHLERILLSKRFVISTTIVLGKRAFQLICSESKLSQHLVVISIALKTYDQQYEKRCSFLQNHNVMSPYNILSSFYTFMKDANVFL